MLSMPLIVLRYSTLWLVYRFMYRVLAVYKSCMGTSCVWMYCMNLSTSPLYLPLL